MTSKLAGLVLGALLFAGCRGSAGNRPAVERAVGAVTTPRGASRPRWEGPDPSFVNLKWGSLHLAPGAASSAELDLVNRGEQPAGPFRVAVYASPGSVVTANRTLLGAAEVDGLGASGRHMVIPFRAPATPGGYAVGIEIDDERRVSGDSRNNNQSGPAQLIVK